jgi:putative inorganic carbon (HCO3(-)) transporter
MGTKIKIKNHCDKIMEFSLYILLFFLPFSKAMIEICATLAILAWIIKRITPPNKLFPSTYLNLPLFIFILITIISIITSTHFALSIRTFFRKTLEYLLLYFVVVEVLCEGHSINISKKKLRNILILILISASIVAIDATIQYFTGKDLIRCYSREAGWITASFRMPNDFAGYLIFIIPIGIILFFLGLKNKKINLYVGIVTALLIIFLIMSGSKGAWIGFMLALVFMSALKSKKIMVFTLVAILILTFFFLISIKTPIKTLITFSDSGGIDRKMMWQSSWNMFIARPWLGQGLGTFMCNYAQYRLKDYPKNFPQITYAHNCYLQTAAEIGIFGLAAFLWLIITPFVKSINLLKRIKDKFYHSLLLGLLGGMLAFLIQSGVDTNLYSLQLSTLFWFMLGFIISVGKILKVEIT